MPSHFWSGTAALPLVPTTPATAQLVSGFSVYRRMFLPTNPNASATDDLDLSVFAQPGDEVSSF